METNIERTNDYMYRTPNLLINILLTLSDAPPTLLLEPLSVVSP